MNREIKLFGKSLLLIIVVILFVGFKSNQQDLDFLNGEWSFELELPNKTNTYEFVYEPKLSIKRSKVLSEVLLYKYRKVKQEKLSKIGISNSDTPISNGSAQIININKAKGRIDTLKFEYLIFRKSAHLKILVFEKRRKNPYLFEIVKIMGNQNEFRLKTFGDTFDIYGDEEVFLNCKRIIEKPKPKSVLVNKKKELNYYGLRGRVKKVTTNSYTSSIRNCIKDIITSQYKLEFSKKGALLSKSQAGGVSEYAKQRHYSLSVMNKIYFGGTFENGYSVDSKENYLKHDSVSVKRNETIETQIFFRKHDTIGRVTAKLENGRVFEKSAVDFSRIQQGSTSYFVYDELGNIEKEEYVHQQNKANNRTIRYKYVRFDNQGNWTKRYKEIYRFKTYGLREVEIQTRLIEYY